MGQVHTQEAGKGAGPIWKASSYPRDLLPVQHTEAGKGTVRGRRMGFTRSAGDHHWGSPQWGVSKHTLGAWEPQPRALGSQAGTTCHLCLLGPASLACPEHRSSWGSGQAWGTESKSTQPTATSTAPGEPPAALSWGRGIRWRNDCTFYLGREGLFKICERQLLVHSRKQPNVLLDTQGREGTSTRWVSQGIVSEVTVKPLPVTPVAVA